MLEGFPVERVLFAHTHIVLVVSSCGDTQIDRYIDDVTSWLSSLRPSVK